MSTIQLDFNLPERFELGYQASYGSRQTPIMIHRALFGSIERFFGVLTEHYAGAFPAWIAPVQVMGVPIAEEFADYLNGFVGELKKAGVRAELDDSDDRMQKKIRTHTKSKIPVLIIVGEEDRSAYAVSLRFYDGTQQNGVPRAQALDIIKTLVESPSRV